MVEEEKDEEEEEEEDEEGGGLGLLHIIFISYKICTI